MSKRDWRFPADRKELIVWAFILAVVAFGIGFQIGSVRAQGVASTVELTGSFTG